MGILESLRQFLQGFPGLGELAVDFTQDGPGNAGLFPVGITEVDRRTDLLGNIQVTYEGLFTLYKRQELGQDGAQWLLDLECWLLNNNDAVQVRKAKIQEASQLQYGLCTVTLAMRLRKTFNMKGESYAENGTVYR